MQATAPKKRPRMCCTSGCVLEDNHLGPHSSDFRCPPGKGSGAFLPGSPPLPPTDTARVSYDALVGTWCSNEDPPRYWCPGDEAAGAWRPSPPPEPEVECHSHANNSNSSTSQQTGIPDPGEGLRTQICSWSLPGGLLKRWISPRSSLGCRKSSMRGLLL